MSLKIILPKLLIITMISGIILSACNKGHDADNIIQSGPTMIDINVIYPQIGYVHSLQVRYNSVIDAPIKVTIAFHLANGQTKHISITIPAGYKNLQQWGNDSYINSWEYTVGVPDPDIRIDPDWEVESLQIIAVSCPDKTFGFKVLTGSDEWTYYHPDDSLTSISFVVNKDTVLYSDYDFKTSGGIIYKPDAAIYGFYLFDYYFQMISETGASYPIENGASIKIPFLLYHWGSRNFGSEMDDGDPDSNGSTLKLTVTKLTDTHFDAVFSGKLWSSRQPDTLFITDGKIKNALLPVKE